MKRIIPLTLLLLFAGCGDMIIEDISEKQIAVIAPSSGAEMNSGKVTFSWEALEYVDHYRLVIVSPSFENLGGIVADTTLMDLFFQPEDDLPHGDYQWRIQGINSEYSTIPQTYSFRVQTAKDITDQAITVITPTTGTEVNKPDVTFSWEPLPGAESYRLMVASPSFAQTQWLAADTTTTENGCRIELPSGDYQWRIQAFNEAYSSAPQTYSFRVRTTTDISKQKVSVITPVAGSEIKSPNVSFSWDPLAGAENYRVMIVSPSFSQVQQVWKDTTTAENGYRLELPDGDYQWRIQALNAEYQNTPQIYPFKVGKAVNISGKSITVIAPTPNVVMGTRPINFIWNLLDGAESYRLLIVSPSFTNVEQVVEDRILTEGQFRVDLPDGAYQWRIEAFNDRYQTTPQTYSFQVLAP